MVTGLKDINVLYDNLKNIKDQFRELMNTMSSSLNNTMSEINHVISSINGFMDYYCSYDMDKISFFNDALKPAQNNLLSLFHESLNLLDEKCDSFRKVKSYLNDFIDFHQMINESITSYDDLYPESPKTAVDRTEAILLKNENDVCLETYLTLESLLDKHINEANSELNKNINEQRSEIERMFSEILSECMDVTKQEEGILEKFQAHSHKLYNLLFSSQLEDIEAQNMDKALFALDFFSGDTSFIDEATASGLNMNYTRQVPFYLVSYKCRVIGRDLESYRNDLNAWFHGFEDDINSEITCLKTKLSSCHEKIDSGHYLSSIRSVLSDILNKLHKSHSCENEILFKLIRCQQRTMELLSRSRSFNLTDRDDAGDGNFLEKDMVALADYISECQDAILDLERNIEKCSFASERVVSTLLDTKKSVNEFLVLLVKKLKNLGDLCGEEHSAYNQLGIIIKNIQQIKEQSSKQCHDLDPLDDKPGPLLPVIHFIHRYLMENLQTGNYKTLLLASLMTEFNPQVDRKVILFDEDD